MIIDIKSEYLPWHVRFFGALLLVGAVIVVANYWWLSIIFLVIGLGLVTAHSGTEVDPVNKTVKEYNSYFFMKNGEVERFSEAQYIFINSGKVTEKFNSPRTANSATFHYAVCNAFLKVDGKKIFLTRNKSKEALAATVAPLAAALGVDVNDMTVANSQA